MAEIDANGIEFLCNDGVPAAWDKAPGNQHYFIKSPGNYTLSCGKIDLQLSPPKAPALVVANEVGNTTVSISWNPPEGMDEHEIRGYCVYRDGQRVHQGDLTLLWVDQGLKGNVEYMYEVSTINIKGDESIRCTGIKVKTNTPGKPGPPAWLKIVSHGADFVLLAWKPPQDHGGASVTAYNIYRDAVDESPSTSTRVVGTVIGRDVNSGNDRTNLEWRDTAVEKGMNYSYRVSAVHLPDETMARTRSQAELMEILKKKASNSLLLVKKDDNEGLCCEAVSGKAVPMLKAPRMGDRDPHIMLQAFNWSSCYSKSGWYNVLHSRVAQMKDAGIDMCWLPPPSDCVDDRGYLPREWYKLDSKYGTHEELKKLVEECHNSGVCPIADVVINHRCASKKDSEGRWTVFTNPDWARWAICNDDPSGLGQGNRSTGPNIEYAPDIDHTNGKIQADAKQYIKWLMEDVGFRALRLDYVLGYGAWLQEQYVRAVGTPYAVAEYWHGDMQVLRNYINATKGVVAVYDFPVYYTLKNAIHRNDFSEMNQGGQLPGIMGCDPVRSVTFVENHDTSHLEVVGGKFGDNNQVCRAYAFILTHCGIPSIFWSDWSDRGEEVTHQITALCKLRKSIGIHCSSRVNIDAAHGGLFASYIDGVNGTIAFKMGSNDWSPHGPGWALKSAGYDYAVWAKGGL